MEEKQRSKVKMFLSAAVVFTSFYYSFLFAIGIIAGYILSRAFCAIFLKTGKIESVLVDYGNWQLHLHHWIMGIMFLGFVWVIDYLYLPTFFAGVVCGVILQDIYDYKDWHKVIVRKEETAAS